MNGMFSKYTQHNLAATQSKIRGSRPTDMAAEKRRMDELVTAGVYVRNANGSVSPAPGDPFRDHPMCRKCYHHPLKDSRPY